MFNITNLIDDKKCFEAVRNLRWEQKVICPPVHIIKDGLHETCQYRQRYNCKHVKNVLMI